MELHESLAQLAEDHGQSLFAEADAFRGALDDYLDEGSASTGTINLLTDAVRLGALQGMLTMLDSGASVEDAVESAGQRLSRDRGSADIAGSQWAVAVLGFALGRVPVELATGLRPDAFTAEPPASGPTAPRPAVSPASPASEPTSFAAPAQPAPPPQPPSQWPSPSAPAASLPQHLQHQPLAAPLSASSPGGHQASPYAYTASPGYGTPPPKKSSTGLLIGAIVAVVILGVAAIVGIIALSGGDGGEGGDDDTTAATDGPTTAGSESSTPVTTNPALTLHGSGYTYQFPNEDWQDLTADTPDDAGTIDTIAAPGNSITTARGNILVETSSAYGETDVENLVDSWKTVISGSTGATPTDIGTMSIGGKDAHGIELKWTNANDFQVHQVAYLVISGGEQYSITASFRQGDSGFLDTFNAVLGTWVWQE